MACDINKLIDDYINGNDIEDYSIEQLENSKAFMEKVIDRSNDYKMYYYCSDKVKTDSGFMRFLIRKFKDKLDFLCEASEFYFEHEKDDDYAIEIALMMKKALQNKDDDRYIKYEMMSDVMYVSLRFQVEQAKKYDEEDYEFKHETGLGFWYIFDLYKNNKALTDFYAKKMINEVFVDDYFSLDKLLHRQYSTVQELEDKGVYNVLIDAIRVHDDMLASYLCVNKELLGSIVNKYYSVIKRWDKYIDLDESKRFDEIYEQVDEYMRNSDESSILSERELECFIGFQLGIEEKLVKYGVLDAVDIELYKEDKDFYLDAIRRSFVDKLNYNNVKRIMKNILLYDNNPELKDNKRGKIVNLDEFRKTKKRIKSRQK